MDTALYDSLAQFFARQKDTTERKGGRRVANQNDKENTAMIDEKAPRLQTLAKEVLALLVIDSEVFRTHGPAESLRKSLISLAMALAQPGVCDAASREKLRLTLDAWLSSERSRLLREDISKARDLALGKI